ncbi:MAG TPA: hypothetical protein VHO01_12500 [Jatrophihabitans sp.]|nr:hypothetical protein [Jatrophihabitans sp.]
MIRWIAQSWDGQENGHDSWDSAPNGEPLPATGYLRPRIWLLARHARVGDVYEVVAPAGSDAAVAGQSAVIAVQVVSG